jgi:hypothetical protein
MGEQSFSQVAGHVPFDPVFRFGLANRPATQYHSKLFFS